MALRYFTTQNPDGTSEFYVSNGVTTVNLGIVGVTASSPDFTALNGEEYFLGAIVSKTSLSDTVGLVFSSNGTAAGTTSFNLTGVNPQLGGGPVYPSDLYVVDNSLLVSATTFEGGEGGIFATSDDGATYVPLTTNVEVGTAGVIVANGVGYFAGINEFQGSDEGLWQTDGTAAGTYQIFMGVALQDGTQSFAANYGQTLLDGAGSDTITAAGSGNDLIIGATATLSFVGSSSPNTVIGGTGSETIEGGAGGGNYSGGSDGNNILISQGGAGVTTQLTGAGAHDQIFGSSTPDSYDNLVAGGGRDSIIGGAGSTNIQAGGAGSIIFTGSGPATVLGGTASGDTIVGGGNNLLVGATDGDAIFGGSGALAVTASTSGNDSIVGGSGALTVAGRGANMLVVAGTSTNNTINTGNGASLIYAGTGSTTLTGGSGSMSIVVGSGNGSFLEGSGVANYELVNGKAGGTDLISNFKTGSDQIDLYGYQPGSYSDVVTGGSSVLTLSDGTKLTLLGVTDLSGSIVG